MSYKGKAFLQSFLCVCHKADSKRKKSARERFFEELGYYYIAVHQHYIGKIFLIVKKRTEIYDTNRKLQKFDSSGIRAMCTWRKEMFEGIFAETIRHSEQKELFKEDNVFWKWVCLSAV